MNIPDYLIISAAAALLQALAHFFPWARVLGRDLYKMEGYVIGTGIILGAQLFMTTYRFLGVGDVLMPALASGLSVIVCNSFTYSLNLRDDAETATKENRIHRGSDEQ